MPDDIVVVRENIVRDGSIVFAPGDRIATEAADRFGVTESGYDTRKGTSQPHVHEPVEDVRLKDVIEPPEPSWTPTPDIPD
jgi:hypothetical protein